MTCHTPHKATFKKRQQAESAATHAAKISRELEGTARDLRPYKCRTCGLYHLTTRKETS